MERGRREDASVLDLAKFLEPENQISLLLANGPVVWIQFGMDDLVWQIQDQTQSWQSKIIIEIQSKKNCLLFWDISGSKSSLSASPF